MSGQNCMEVKPSRLGWQCPGCGVCVSPDETTCPVCRKEDNSVFKPAGGFPPLPGLGRGNPLETWGHITNEQVDTITGESEGKPGFRSLPLITKYPLQYERTVEEWTQDFADYALSYDPTFLMSAENAARVWHDRIPLPPPLSSGGVWGPEGAVKEPYVALPRFQPGEDGEVTQVNHPGKKCSCPHCQMVRAKAEMMRSGLPEGPGGPGQ